MFGTTSGILGGIPSFPVFTDLLLQALEHRDLWVVIAGGSWNTKNLTVNE